MKKEIPFTFILDELFDQQLTIKPMFGCHALYKGDRLLLIVRRKSGSDEDNGVWVATSSTEDREALKKKFPSMRDLKLFGTQDTAWQNIPEDSSSFEEDVMHVCELIRKGDQRIGKVPAKKKKKSTVKNLEKQGTAKKTVTGSKKMAKKTVTKKKDKRQS